MPQLLSMASAVVATDVLHGIPGIEPAPMWQTLSAASSITDKSRRVTPAEAADLANVLGVRWTMTGEISPGPDGYLLTIDFIPAKSSLIPFRYQRSVQPESLKQRLDEALEQFLGYARRPAPQLKTQARTGDWKELFRLAEAVDKEYGWFSPPAAGRAQQAFASLVANDPRLANLLFDPGLYAATRPVPAAASEPADVSGVEPHVEPAPVMPAAIATTGGLEPEPEKPSPPPPLSPPAEIPRDSTWAPLTVPPILSLLTEQQLHPPQSAAEINRRASERSSASSPGRGGASGGTTPGRQYVLQLFASADRTEAGRFAQDLAQGGVPTKVSVIRGKHPPLYRVSDGTYDSPEKASAAGDAIIALRMADEYWVRAEAAPKETRGQAPLAPPHIPSAAGPAAGKYQIQVFASVDREKAAALAEELRQIGLHAQVELFNLPGGGDCYRVRLAGYESRDEAVSEAETLRAQGRIHDYWIVS